MTVLIAVRFVQGAAGAAGIVVGRAVVADLFAGKVAAAYFSAIATINGLAPILAPVIGGQVLRVGTWRTVFWVLAGIGVVLFVLAALVDHASRCRRSGASAAGSAAPCGPSARCSRDRGYVGRVLAGTIGHRRDVRLHLGLAVPAAGRVRAVRAVVQRLLRAERARHRRWPPRSAGCCCAAPRRSRC